MVVECGVLLCALCMALWWGARQQKQKKKTSVVEEEEEEEEEEGSIRQKTERARM